MPRYNAKVISILQAYTLVKLCTINVKRKNIRLDNVHYQNCTQSQCEIPERLNLEGGPTRESEPQRQSINV